MINERIAATWSDLNECLFADTYNSEIDRYRSSFAYRGMQDASYVLRTSLKRIGIYQGLEQNLLKQFRKYANRDVVEKNTDWHWLSVAQHHGLPTRLLDWTYSPLVALHFATFGLESHDGKDAVVWKVNYSQTHQLLQRAEQLSLEKANSRIFSVDLLADTIHGLAELENRSASNYEVAVFFEPPSIDDRIVNQFAYFSVVSDPYLDFNDWLALPHVSAVVDAVKIVIPAGLKWEVRDKLDQCNITERIMMPGLDGLCSWLKRHYSPKP